MYTCLFSSSSLHIHHIIIGNHTHIHSSHPTLTPAMLYRSLRCMITRICVLFVVAINTTSPHYSYHNRYHGVHVVVYCCCCNNMSLRYVNVGPPSGLVKISAICSFVGTHTTLTSLSFIKSLI